MSAEDMLGKAAELRGWSTGSRHPGMAGATTPCSTGWSSLRAKTGDIRRTRWCPTRLVFPHTSYWANHFGGVSSFSAMTGPPR
jgi:hypothetical protein